MNNHTDRFFHPWHSLPIGKKAPHIVQAIVEIQQGSKAKYELDKLTGFLRLDRILASDLRYPVHYGFIPQTYCQDDDPLDILILCSENLLPLSIVEARIIGGIKMLDGHEQDDKIIAVAENDPLMNQKYDIGDLNPEVVNTIRYFFEHYKIPEGKSVAIEQILSCTEAIAIVQESIALYDKKFRTKIDSL